MVQNLYNPVESVNLNKTTNEKPPHLHAVYGKTKPNVNHAMPKSVREYLADIGHGIGN